MSNETELSSQAKEFHESRLERLRSAIRFHRDQAGDDRCWLDDYILYRELPDSAPEPASLPNAKEMFERCSRYFNQRGCSADTSVYRQACVASTPPVCAETTDEIMRIESAIRAHREKGELLTWKDDLDLYMTLPEKKGANFSLTPKDEFLYGWGESGGCPHFWRSHLRCCVERHDLHSWGPCKR
jgi:hypothetical protein